MEGIYITDIISQGRVSLLLVLGLLVVEEDHRT